MKNNDFSFIKKCHKKRKIVDYTNFMVVFIRNATDFSMSPSKRLIITFK